VDTFDVAFLKGVITFILLAGTTLGAWRMWLRTRYSLQPTAESLLEELREDNAQLRRELDARLAELEERVDFTERRMLQERALQRLPGQTARTPV